MDITFFDKCKVKDMRFIIGLSEVFIRFSFLLLTFVNSVYSIFIRLPVIFT